MFPIRTVFCPVDFPPATPRQVDVAADLCRAFGARLVVHHNVNSMGTVAAVGWMWLADHPPASPEQVGARLQAQIARVPAGVETETRVTQGPPMRTVLDTIDAIKPDLVVLSAHASAADDHASVTEEVLSTGQRAVLVLHDAHVEEHTPHFASTAGGHQVILVPSDLTPESHAAVSLAVDLARRLPVGLHLLHLLPAGSDRRPDFAGLAAAARHRLGALVPDDLQGRVRLRVEAGDAAEGILRAARSTAAHCIVMGEHTRAPIRRWLSRDTAQAVLREAPCPVWYVPGQRHAIGSAT